MTNGLGAAERRTDGRNAAALPPARATAVADLEVVELGLERLDRAVSLFEILVETVALGDELNKQVSASGRGRVV